LTLSLLPSCTQSIPYKVDHKYPIDSPAFRQTLGNLLGPPLVDGNRITTLRNGDQIFPAMLAAIRSARRTITFETFVYWKGTIGQEFADALTDRARHGVRVHVILDWLGTDKIDPAYLDEMKSAGVQIVRYHKIHWYTIPTALKVDHRTHRKLLVVDGRIGLIGGVGIADEWAGDARNPHEWRDNHYQIEGPLVAQLQAAFNDNWIKTTGQVLHGPDYFPVLHPAGPSPAQVFKSGPQGGADSMQLLYLLSVAAAEHHIRLASAYFIPDDLTTKSLLDARKRGVQIDILLPGPQIDIEPVRQASRAKWGPLLKAGVRIYEFQPTMFHVKQAIFDDRWVSIGSSNLDPRSFRLNDEANLNVLDPAFAAEQIRLFEQDKSRAREITYDHWSHRPFDKRLHEVLPSLLTPEL
jgi:cardiolipin synthase